MNSRTRQMLAGWAAPVNSDASPIVPKARLLMEVTLSKPRWLVCGLGLIDDDLNLFIAETRRFQTKYPTWLR